VDSHFNVCLPDRTYLEKTHELPDLVEQVAQQDLPGSSFQSTSLQAYFVTLQDGEILNKILAI